MYNPNKYSYYNTPGYYSYNINQRNQTPYWTNKSNVNNAFMPHIRIADYGPEPFAIDISEASEQNNNFRTALWTGNHLQVTLMSLNVGENIGWEVHPDLDQFIRIEEGQGIVMMGDSADDLNFQANVSEDYAFIIPAGKYHNLFNTGYRPLKLYSIYAPPQHPHGTVHRTKAEAEAAE